MKNDKPRAYVWKMTPELEAKLVPLFRKGLPMPSIARQMKLSIETLKKYYESSEALRTAESDFENDCLKQLDKISVRWHLERLHPESWAAKKYDAPMATAPALKVPKAKKSLFGAKEDIENEPGDDKPFDA